MDSAYIKAHRASVDAKREGRQESIEQEKRVGQDKREMTVLADRAYGQWPSVSASPIMMQSLYSIPIKQRKPNY